MLKKKEVDPNNKSDQNIEFIEIKPRKNIADIGSERDYFTLRFAKIVVSKGIVYTFGTNQEHLQFIKGNAKKKLNNIVTILSNDKLYLPEGSLYFIFMKNVTHYITNRLEYFENKIGVFKSNNKIIIIEYKRIKILDFKGYLGFMFLK